MACNSPPHHIYLLFLGAYFGIAVNFSLIYRITDFQNSHSLHLQQQQPLISPTAEQIPSQRSKRASHDFSSASEDRETEIRFKDSERVNQIHHISHPKTHHNNRHRKRHSETHRTSGGRSSDSRPAVVEFFPKPQTTEPSPEHVWLSSYSRIPLPALQDFCSSTQEYCPPGAPGGKGDKGKFTSKKKLNQR